MAAALVGAPAAATALEGIARATLRQRSGSHQSCIPSNQSLPSLVSPFSRFASSLDHVPPTSLHTSVVPPTSPHRVQSTLSFADSRTLVSLRSLPVPSCVHLLPRNLRPSLIRSHSCLPQGIPAVRSPSQCNAVPPLLPYVSQRRSKSKSLHPLSPTISPLGPGRAVKHLDRSQRGGNFVRAAGSDSTSDSSSEYETVQCPVPRDQRPIFEYESLKEAQLFAWATLQGPDYAVRLLIVWVVFFVALAAPIAAVTFPPSRYPLEFALAGGAGALVIVTTAVLRLYLGWSYVGNRLYSATVEYEETGWYDGQVWVKPPEVLARDRLLGFYQVKPTLERLKLTLLALGSGVAASALGLLVLLLSGEANAGGLMDAYNSSPGSSYSQDAAQLYEPDGDEQPSSSSSSVLDHMRTWR